MAQGNPLFNEKAFRQSQSLIRVGEEMTLQGTINKTLTLLLICTLGGIFAWNHYQSLIGFSAIIAGITFILALVIIFKKNTAPFLAPVYAIGEGFILGAISAAYNVTYEGIVAQAIIITLLVFAVMLFIYRTGIIRVNRTFVIAITSATAAVALFYFISIVLSFFGHTPAYFTSNSTTSIIINIIICLVAAFNFLIDFAFIDHLTSTAAVPKYMEWYAGFSLLVTLIWLYLEILRTLGRSRSRR